MTIFSHRVVWSSWCGVVECGVLQGMCVGAVASCGSIGVEWFGNAADRSYGIENHHRLHTYTHKHKHETLHRSSNNTWKKRYMLSGGT
jgi:hypothetical protein